MDKLVCIETKVEVNHFTYQWKIQNFQFICNRPVGKALNSPIFTIPGTDVNGWLKIYPGGVDEQYSDYVSVYLELKNDGEADLLGRLSLSIAEIDGYRRNSELVNFSMEEICGYPEFVRRKYLLNNSTLIKDELTLMLNLSVSTGIVKSLNQSDEIVIIESRLVKDLEKLLEKQSYTDVTFAIEEQRFKAHKIILMARSKVFEKMFMDQPNKREFVIDDVSFSLMNHLLQYIYTGKVNVAGMELMDFVHIAWRYGLANPELQDRCEKQLFSQIDDDNAIDLLTFGDEYIFNNLFDNSLNYIVKNFSKIVHTDNYKSLARCSPGLVGCILMRLTENFTNNSL